MSDQSGFRFSVPEERSVSSGILVSLVYSSLCSRALAVQATLGQVPWKNVEAVKCAQHAPELLFVFIKSPAVKRHSLQQRANLLQI